MFRAGRVALGAQTSQVVNLSLHQATTPVIVGLVAGRAGGWWVDREPAVRSACPRSVITMAVVAVVGSIGLATCAFAARQGLTLDPAGALRDE